MLMSSASLEGAMHTMWGKLAMKVTSKEPAWVAPSAPTMPARSMANRTGENKGHETSDMHGIGRKLSTERQVGKQRAGA